MNYMYNVKLFSNINYMYKYKLYVQCKVIFKYKIKKYVQMGIILLCTIAIKSKNRYTSS